MLTNALSLLNRLSPRSGFLLVGLAAWALSISGLALSYVEQLEPCPLCIFQRLLFMVFGTLALLAAAFVRSGKGSCRMVGLTLALPCIWGFGVAIYQTLMQSAPGFVQECDRAAPGLIEDFVDWLGLYWMEHVPFLPDLFFASGSCSSKEWVFLGFSLANWAAVFFALFAAFTLMVSGWFMRRLG
ncbi:MAG: disulfide bond formation protein B [Betaproteobacteria bacterium]|nr:disulfide bond formation protein B [Betaproteobacteria bacterium]